MKGLKSYFSSINPALLAHVSGKPKEFIRIFREQNFLTEEAFKSKICEDKYNDVYYRKRKSDAIKILQALVIISDVKKGSLTKKKYDKCQKKFTVGQKMLMQGDRDEGIRLIKQAYQIAVEYDFSYQACELTSILYNHFVYYERNKRLARYYAKQMKKYLNDYTAEKEAEYYFYQIVMEQMYSTLRVDFLLEASQNVSQRRGDSIRYKFIEASINVLYNLYTGDYEQIIIGCTDAFQFFKTKAGAYPAYYFFILSNMGISQTAIGKYAEAAESYQEAEQYTVNKPYNAYSLQYYKMLNTLHAGHYQTAYDLYQKNKRCKIEDIRQHFAIIEAYLCFLTHTGYLQLDKHFRMGKYLNDTFKAQEDKQGDNINILIAELLVYLARDRGKFIDRIEAVQHYSYRHLKGADTQRAKWFIKILCMMPKVDFHPVALRRKAKRYFDLLESHPVRMGEGFAVEIIPYTDLLDMIVERLMKKVA